MSGNHRAELAKVAIHQSLVRPILMLGGERVLVIMSAMISGYMGYLLTMRFGMHYGLPVGGAMWGSALFILRRMGQADPRMWSVIMRGKKYKSYYPARGRFDAAQPTYNDFN